MKSAARFVLLLTVGVMIMVLYVRSGDSFIVLILSLLTVLAGLAIWVAEPWKVDDGERGQRWDETWRCGHDVTWDQQGIRAVKIGDRLPELTLWSRVDRIDVGHHQASADDRATARRRGLRLGLYPTVGRPRAGATDRPAGRSDDRVEVWLCLGPDQDPDLVANELSSAWRRATTRRHSPNPDR